MAAPGKKETYEEKMLRAAAGIDLACSSYRALQPHQMQETMMYG